MDSQPLVSIVIPTYNAETFITDALDSAFIQTYKNTEVIVIDDGSKDNTISVISAYQQHVPFKLIQQNNQGPSGARNAGMQQSHGKYICFLDADDRLLPDSIERRVKCLEQRPEVDLIFTDIVRIDAQNTAGYPFLKQQQFLTKFQPVIKENHPEYWIFNDRYFEYAMKIFPFIWTSSVMIRKQVIASVGYFNPALRGSEDIEYWMRIAKQGTLAYINAPLSEWHHYLSGMTRPGHYQFYTDTIKCYQQFKRDLKEKKYLRAIINQRLGHYAFAGGYEAFSQHAFQPAREFFRQACLFQPFVLRYWYYALVSCLPSWLIIPLRVFKQRLR